MLRLSKKVLCVFMAILMICGSFAVFSFAEETTAVEEESTTSMRDGIISKIENTDLGIDGFGITEMLGKILDWLKNLVDNIRDLVTNTDKEYGDIFDKIFPTT